MMQCRRYIRGMGSRAGLLDARALSCLLLCLVVLAAGCATRGGGIPEITMVPRASDYQPRWEPLFRGIDYAMARKMAPDPQALYAVRVDLKAPGIEFLVTPSNGDRPLETDGRKTSTFLKEFKCQLAINASPFSPVEQVEGAPKDILGPSVSRGDVYSQAHGGHGVMLITQDNHVSFAEPPFDLSTAYNAVGGYGMLVKNGVVQPSDKVRHPRTAVGTSEDGRYLYLLLIDGRQPGYSVGATTGEAAAWIKQIGAYTALNLDGGGSTSLVIDDGQGGCTVLNRPIHDNIPGNERVNGNHLGIFARRLSGK